MTLMSRWPPLTMEKDSSWAKKLVPGMILTGWPPAFTKSGSPSPAVCTSPKPSTPFSLWNTTSRPAGT